MRYIVTSILIFCLTLLLFTGCMMDTVTPELDNGGLENQEDINQGSNDSQNLSKGTLKIYLTDALEKNDDNGAYENIFISISRIEAHFVETYEEELGTEVADGSKKGNWQPIADWSKEGGFEVDLIELEGKSILLASLEQLPSRKYTQLRIFLEDPAIIVVNGEENNLDVVNGEENNLDVVNGEELDIPSVEQTGIKLNHPFEITPGYITELTLDFDAQKSIIKTGNGEYKLKPVIGIISNTYSQVEGELYLGSIEGLVYGLDEEEKEVVIVGASVKIEGLILPFEETATTGSDGYYTIINIPFGVYTVTASAGGYTDAFKPVSIDSGEVITVDFWLEPEEPEEPEGE